MFLSWFLFSRPQQRKGFNIFSEMVTLILAWFTQNKIMGCHFLILIEPCQYLSALSFLPDSHTFGPRRPITTVCLYISKEELIFFFFVCVKFNFYYMLVGLFYLMQFFYLTFYFLKVLLKVQIVHTNTS